MTHNAEIDAGGSRRRAAFQPCTTQAGEHCANCPRYTLAECIADLARVTPPGGCDHTYPPATDGTCPSCGKARVIPPAVTDQGGV